MQVREISIFLLSVISLALVSCSGTTECIGEPGIDWIEGEIIVEFIDEIETEEEANRVMQEEGLDIVMFVVSPEEAVVATDVGKECETIIQVKKLNVVEDAYLSLVVWAK